MTCPKRKYPKSAKLKRRSHLALSKPATVTCDNCRQPKLGHTICATCGYYRGRQVIDMTPKKDKKNAA